MVIGNGFYLEKLPNKENSYMINPPAYCPKCKNVIRLFEDSPDCIYKATNIDRNTGKILATCMKCKKDFGIPRKSLFRSKYGVLKLLNGLDVKSKKYIRNLINEGVETTRLFIIFDESLIKESKRYAITLFHKRCTSKYSEEQWLEESLSPTCWKMNLHSSMLYEAETELRRNRKIINGVKMIKTQGLREEIEKKEDEEC